MELVALIVAAAVIALAVIARDAFIRALADRAESRTLRATEAEWKADAATKAVGELEKKTRELEKLVHANAARSIRR